MATVAMEPGSGSAPQGGHPEQQATCRQTAQIPVWWGKAGGCHEVLTEKGQQKIHDLRGDTSGEPA